MESLFIQIYKSHLHKKLTPMTGFVVQGHIFIFCLVKLEASYLNKLFYSSNI